MKSKYMMHLTQRDMRIGASGTPRYQKYSYQSVTQYEIERAARAMMANKMLADHFTLISVDWHDNNGEDHEVMRLRDRGDGAVVLEFANQHILNNLLDHPDTEANTHGSEAAS